MIVERIQDQTDDGSTDLRLVGSSHIRLTIHTPGMGDVWTEWTPEQARQIRDALTAWIDVEQA